MADGIAQDGNVSRPQVPDLNASGIAWHSNKWRTTMPASRMNGALHFAHVNVVLCATASKPSRAQTPVRKRHMTVHLWTFSLTLVGATKRKGTFPQIIPNPTQQRDYVLLLKLVLGFTLHSTHKKSRKIPPHHAFAECVHLSSVDLSGLDSLRTIGACAFEKCENLNTIYVTQITQGVGKGRRLPWPAIAMILAKRERGAIFPTLRDISISHTMHH